MASRPRAALRITGFLLLTVAVLPVQAIAVAFRLRLAGRVPLLYHSLCCRIFGFSIHVLGERSLHSPTLFVSNHISYADIAVLGSLIPGSFVARADIANWPLFGLLAKLDRTVLIERVGRLAAKHRDDMLSRLAAGDNLVLFPEGTSNDGNSVLPFKSSLFAVAGEVVNGGKLTVQPISIAYTRLDGMPIGREFRPHYAWYGDMDLVPHLWRMLGLGHVDIVVEFHPTVARAGEQPRKSLAAHCHRVIAAGVDAANAGRQAVETNRR